MQRIGKKQKNGSIVPLKRDNFNNYYEMHDSRTVLMQATDVHRCTATTLGTAKISNIMDNSKFQKIFFVSNLVLQVRMWN